jgi:tyrosyl-tRNA synthetase
MENNEIQALRRTLCEVIPDTALDAIIRADKSLKIKFGADPSAPDLHLGQT